MDRARVPALVGASVLTVVTGISYCHNWHITSILRAATIAAWTIFAIADATERILGTLAEIRAERSADVAQLRADIIELRNAIETYGDQRHSDGIIDGLSKANAAQPQLRTVR